MPFSSRNCPLLRRDTNMFCWNSKKLTKRRIRNDDIYAAYFMTCILWIILTIIGISSFNTQIEPYDEILLAFRFTYLNVKDAEMSPLIVKPASFQIICWLYLIISVVWLIINLVLIAELCKKRTKISRRLYYTWLIYTWLICVLDFIIFVVFLVDLLLLPKRSPTIKPEFFSSSKFKSKKGIQMKTCKLCLPTASLELEETDTTDLQTIEIHILDENAMFPTTPTDLTFKSAKKLSKFQFIYDFLTSYYQFVQMVSLQKRDMFNWTFNIFTGEDLYANREPYAMVKHFKETLFMLLKKIKQLAWYKFRTKYELVKNVVLFFYNSITTKKTPFKDALKWVWRVLSNIPNVKAYFFDFGRKFVDLASIFTPENLFNFQEFGNFFKIFGKFPKIFTLSEEETLYEKLGEVGLKYLKIDIMDVFNSFLKKVKNMYKDAIRVKQRFLPSSRISKQKLQNTKEFFTTLIKPVTSVFVKTSKDLNNPGADVLKIFNYLPDNIQEVLQESVTGFESSFVKPFNVTLQNFGNNVNQLIQLIKSTENAINKLPNKIKIDSNKNQIDNLINKIKNIQDESLEEIKTIVKKIEGGYTWFPGSPNVISILSKDIEHLKYSVWYLIDEQFSLSEVFQPFLDKFVYVFTAYNELIQAISKYLRKIIDFSKEFSNISMKSAKQKVINGSSRSENVLIDYQPGINIYDSPIRNFPEESSFSFLDILAFVEPLLRIASQISRVFSLVNINLDFTEYIENPYLIPMDDLTEKTYKPIKIEKTTTDAPFLDKITQTTKKIITETNYKIPISKLNETISRNRSEEQSLELLLKAILTYENKTLKEFLRDFISLKQNNVTTSIKFLEKTSKKPKTSTKCSQNFTTTEQFFNPFVVSTDSSIKDQSSSTDDDITNPFVTINQKNYKDLFKKIFSQNLTSIEQFFNPFVVSTDSSIKDQSSFTEEDITNPFVSINQKNYEEDLFKKIFSNNFTSTEQFFNPFIVSTDSSIKGQSSSTDDDINPFVLKNYKEDLFEKISEDPFSTNKDYILYDEDENPFVKTSFEDKNETFEENIFSIPFEESSDDYSFENKMLNPFLKWSKCSTQITIQTEDSTVSSKVEDFLEKPSCDNRTDSEKNKNPFVIEKPFSKWSKNYTQVNQQSEKSEDSSQIDKSLEKPSYDNKTEFNKIKNHFVIEIKTSTDFSLNPFVKENNSKDLYYIFSNEDKISQENFFKKLSKSETISDEENNLEDLNTEDNPFVDKSFKRKFTDFISFEENKISSTEIISSKKQPDFISFETIKDLFVISLDLLKKRKNKPLNKEDEIIEEDFVPSNDDEIIKKAYDSSNEDENSFVKSPTIFKISKNNSLPSNESSLISNPFVVLSEYSKRVTDEEINSTKKISNHPEETIFWMKLLLSGYNSQIDKTPNSVDSWYLKAKSPNKAIIIVMCIACRGILMWILNIILSIRFMLYHRKEDKPVINWILNLLREKRTEKDDYRQQNRPIPEN